MKILLDARFYGLENEGLGRYTMNLIKELSLIDSNNQYIILLKEKYFKKINLPKNWEKVEVNFPHYSFQEQIILPNIIKKYNPDLTHFLIIFGNIIRSEEHELQSPDHLVCR